MTNTHFSQVKDSDTHIARLIIGHLTSIHFDNSQIFTQNISSMEVGFFTKFLILSPSSAYFKVSILEDIFNSFSYNKNILVLLL